MTEIATTCGFDPLMGWNDFVTFGALTDLRDGDVECREGRQMVFRDPDDIAALALTDSTALVLPEVLALAPTSLHGRRSGATTSSPACSSWTVAVGCCCRNATSTRASTPRSGDCPAATSIPARTSRPVRTVSWRRRRGSVSPPVRSSSSASSSWTTGEPYGTFDRMQVFAAATDLADADIECHEGRRIVFVEPERARGLDLSSAAADIVPAFLDSDHYRRLTRSGPHSAGEPMTFTVHPVPGPGAEDVVVTPDGDVYTGTEDGSIFRLSPDGQRVERVAQTGGRPLGLELFADGDLLVCDAHRGLLVVH